ncbi:EmrB/QacA subfamily drug resistance transporter [Scopulibacillus darangshiensis]|uniref:EmrB/QacA subfamily drug resistance transporter n=1 Tax=Scopulibacillus darangshiensis TaxID=442528 RepID=A0A4R2NDX5_9BACL|nr:MFS transporter [Scopulibacillus darangshiensis]TCP19304.1 EmrB/QacA subfamily drug resistance transporter [Scopulibacillus darangshiensis]
MKTNRHLVVFIVLIGAMLAPINSTMIAVGLPIIADSLQQSLGMTTWVVTLYLIAMAVVQPISGRLGDIFGSSKMFIGGLGLFLLASVGCAFSFSLWWLIVCRVLQALGGACMTPNVSALFRRITPPEQLGKVFSWFGLGMGAGAAIGPILGSVLIQLWGWRSIFWVNVPIGLIALVTAIFFLPKFETDRSQSVDGLGALYLGIILSLFVLITQSGFPWYTNLILLVILVIATFLFIRQEKRRDQPLVDFSLFKRLPFTGGDLSILISNCIMYSTLLSVPFVLESELNIPAKSSGFILFFFSLSMSFFTWLGGQKAEKWGKRRLVLLSFSISGLALILYIGFFAFHSLAYVIVSLLIGGLGAGIGLTAIQVLTLEAVPKHVAGIASGINMTFRYIGSIIGTMFLSVLSYSVPLFIVLILFSIMGLFVAYIFFKPSIRLAGDHD